MVRQCLPPSVAPEVQGCARPRGLVLKSKLWLENIIIESFCLKSLSAAVHVLTCVVTAKGKGVDGRAGPAKRPVATFHKQMLLEL
jgi:hypothetical protein